MGAYKQMELERIDYENARMRDENWPRCLRCDNPIDYELVQLSEEDEPFYWPDFCGYCS